VFTTLQSAPQNDQCQLPPSLGASLPGAPQFEPAVDTAYSDGPVSEPRKLNEVDADAFVREYTKAVQGIASRVARSSKMGSMCGAAADPEDLFQVGIMAGLTAAQKYDPGKGKRQQNYIYMMAEFAMRDYLRNEFPHAMVQKFGVERLVLEDGSNIEQSVAVSQAVGTLSDRKKEMIQLYFVDGESCAEIGRRWEVSRERARQILEETLSELRGALSIEKKEPVFAVPPTGGVSHRNPQEGNPPC
jgi:RNA polymerase sigma factor (sigma-70 family)